MSDPVMDKIEQDLRAMSEEHTEPTQLWKRALEVSRADERSSLVHPARDAEFETKPDRGRRLFLALNTVGVAAIVMLAAGVWTIAASSPSPVEHALQAGESIDLVTDSTTVMPEMSGMDAMASIPPEADAAPMASMSRKAGPTGHSRELLADADLGNAPLRFAEETRQRRSIQNIETDTTSDAKNETVIAGAPVEAARDSLVAIDDTSMEPVEPADGVAKPGISQMAMGLEDGIVLNLGNGALFGPTMTSLPAIENAHIVIEVDDIDEAFVAVSELPDAEQDEFSTLDLSLGEASADELTLNIAPARMDEALVRIRGLGRVVEETRSPDSQLYRANAAMNVAAEQIEPQRAAIDELNFYNGLTEHEKRHLGLQLDEDERIATLTAAITDLARRLEDARRSINLSRVRVSIKATEQPGDTTE